jgi:hypothetical protein
LLENHDYQNGGHLGGSYPQLCRRAHDLGEGIRVVDAFDPVDAYAALAEVSVFAILAAAAAAVKVQRCSGGDSSTTTSSSVTFSSISTISTISIARPIDTSAGQNSSRARSR